MIRTIIDIHILQTVPPSNINRDDTGSPKTAVYGGVRRARVSSQAWKRAVRLAFEEHLDDEQLGERTKRVGEAIAARIEGLDPDLKAESAVLAFGVLKAAGLVKKEPKKDGHAEAEYLLFLSHRQQQLLAELAVKAAQTGKAPDTKMAKEAANREHSIDIALFGRMVADVSDINVDAAAQVAHAISVHGVENEFDYYTAVDDRKHDAQETGAGMIGSIEFNSSTLYRYATVDVDRLHETLGDPTATRKAIEAFLLAFTLSMPTGKQNTFANGTRPDAVVVQLRDTRSINFVAAFEEPVTTTSIGAGGRVGPAAKALAAYAAEIHKAYGENPIAGWVTHVGSRTAVLAALGTVLPIPAMVDAVGEKISARFGGQP